VQVKQLKTMIRSRSAGWVKDEWESDGTLVRCPLMPCESRAFPHWPVTLYTYPHLYHGMFLSPPRTVAYCRGVGGLLRDDTFDDMIVMQNAF